MGILFSSEDKIHLIWRNSKCIEGVIFEGLDKFFKPSLYCYTTATKPYPTKWGGLHESNNASDSTKYYVDCRGLTQPSPFTGLETDMHDKANIDRISLYCYILFKLKIS